MAEKIQEFEKPLSEMTEKEKQSVLKILQEELSSPKEVPLLILYGSESGNSESLAFRSEKEGKRRGLICKIKSMEEISISEIQEYARLLIIVSTWGEGEAPQTAEKFFADFFSSDLDLKNLEFSVCGLGDISYEKFCQAGKDMDTRLEKFGAKRIVERVDCDVDFESSYEEWVEKVWSVWKSPSFSPPINFTEDLMNEEEYGKKNPFPASILENQVLNFPPSEKETRHIELDLAGSGFSYVPGDTLAVVPQNQPDYVEEILKILDFDENTEVQVQTKSLSLKEALISSVDITTLTFAIVKKYEAVAKNKTLSKFLKKKEEVKHYCEGRELIDLLVDYPSPTLSVETFLSFLRKLPPRLYSIASSPRVCHNEVHLTVATVRYETAGRKRKGVASTYLAERCITGTKVLVYTQENKHFRLPEDSLQKIIMVGPGTGIAPFRAFLQEREVAEQKGEAWLFFGDRSFTNDFLYQLELQEFLESKTLTHLDVAFSRDQEKKIYVQDKLREKGELLYQWLQQGAYFYVCGDASKMAGDVHQALLEIIRKFGKKSEGEAEEYLQTLKKQKRYQRDTY